MNILYISQTPPSDTRFGGGQRTRMLYDALKRCGEVYCLYHYGDGDTPDGRIKKIEWRERTGLLHYLNVLSYRIRRLLLPGLPELETLFYPFPSRMPIERIFPDVRFDAVVVRYYHLAGRLHLWKYAPLFVDVDDHPLQVYRTAMRPRCGLIRRMVYDFAMRWACRRLESKFSGGWVVSADQRTLVRDGVKLDVLRNIPKMTCAGYVRSPERAMRLVTVGVMAHGPNVEGVDGFLAEVWPKVRERYPLMEYWVVGGGASDEVSRRWNAVPGVKVCGFVEDLESVYSVALASVVPVRSGGGSCIKTLESLAHSCTCLSTEFGARGIDGEFLRDGAYGLRVWRTADDFVSQLSQLLSEADMISENERRGRKMIEDQYSLSAFEESVVKLFDKDDCRSRCSS